MNLELSNRQTEVVLKAINLRIVELKYMIDEYELNENYEGVKELTSLYTAKSRLEKRQCRSLSLMSDK